MNANGRAVRVAPGGGMFGWLFRRGWVDARAKVVDAAPKHHDTTSASVPYDAVFEVHVPGDAAPVTVKQRLTVGRGRPFGANVWVAVRVSPARDAVDIDWERTPAVQLESGDAASRVMAAMAMGITDPARIQELLGVKPTEPRD